MGKAPAYIVAAIIPVMAGTSLAGTEAVPFPDGYASRFERYATVDRPDRDPPIVRFLYVNKQALEQAREGEPLPYGTILVMEDHLAQLDDEKAVLDGNGRLVPTDRVTNIFVQQKEQGWGTEYPPDIRNGEWEYAWFLPGGTRKKDADFDRCFSCHKGQADSDYNFTFGAYLGERAR